MTTEEIKKLRAQIRRLITTRDSHLRLTEAQALYLEQVVSSHITWREWLVPED